MCMLIFLCDYKPNDSGCLRNQKSVKSHGAKVPSSCQPPEMGVEN